MSQLCGSDDVQTAKLLLSKAGLTFPPLPHHLARDFKEWGQWSFSTRPPRRLSPYAFDHYVEEGTSQCIEDYMLLAHAGHGVNSYALHYYLIRGPLRLFLQLDYGGAYSDEKSSCRVINDSFALVARLIATLDEAPAEKRFVRNDRLIIAGSTFYGTYWVRPRGRRCEVRIDCPIFEQPVQGLNEALQWIEAKVAKPPR